MKATSYRLFFGVFKDARFFERLRKQWQGHTYAELHNYGLGQARDSGKMFLANSGSSLFHPMEFSGKRLFLDSVSDFETGRLREGRATVRVEQVEVVWRVLSTEDLGLLHMCLEPTSKLLTCCELLRVFSLSEVNALRNCEGCEYEVLPLLAAAGLLEKIQAAKGILGLHRRLPVTLGGSETWLHLVVSCWFFLKFHFVLLLTVSGCAFKPRMKF